ncbi:MAG TPA: hypothetical protein VKY91_07700, partial [Vulgatibacteraceae bacterium]|nr:hypothetical protein [Vulgatibacteraceae bacterium]
MTERLQRLGRDLHATLDGRLRRQMLPHYLAAAVLAVGITVSGLPASRAATVLVVVGGIAVATVLLMWRTHRSGWRAWTRRVGLAGGVAAGWLTA